MVPVPRPLCALLLAVTLVTTGCDATTGPAGETRGLSVVATTPVLADLARSIVGDRGSVRSLIPAGADPHQFRLTELDLGEVESADLVLAVGPGFEREFEELVDRVAEAEVEMMVTTEHLARAVQTREGELDPHFWHDPDEMAALAPVVAERLGEIDAGRKRSYRGTARALARTYRELGDEVAGLLSPVPEQRRALITQHDFFRYFARRFGFEVLATVVEGLSSEGEPSAEGRQAIISTLENRRLCVMFSPASASDPLTEGIAVEADLTVDVVNVFADTFPDGDTTYEEIMLENARTLAAAFTGCG